MWTISLSNRAVKDLQAINSQDKKRILAFLYQRIQHGDDPQSTGRPLAGAWKHYWRYRVGNYRIICDIRHDVLEILVITIGHRREVYD